MRVVGIVTEFNPFHNGHKHLIDAVKKEKNTAVVCVMSGNYTQRGEPALLNKWYRTQMALACGADLVLDLPTPWAVSASESFARGGVSILGATGIVDTLCFGSEAGNVHALKELGEDMLSPTFQEEVAKQMMLGVSYPVAQTTACEKVYGEKKASLLKEPNNTLGLAYIRAIEKLGLPMKVETVKRHKVEHDSVQTADVFSSASTIRSKIQQGEDVSVFLSSESSKILQKALKNGHAPFAYDKMSLPMLSAFRKMSASDFARVPDVTEGLENRIVACVKNATTLKELEVGVKSKRFTMSRIRRILLRAFLCVPDKIHLQNPPYIHVLGFTQTGRKLLSDMKKNATLPLVTQYSDLSKAGSFAKEIFELESTFTDVYSLFLPKPESGGQEKTNSVIVYDKKETYYT